MKAVIVPFILFNLITFCLFGMDKFFARTNRQRISEKTLLTFVIAGGSVGAIFAQKLFRHKTRKFRYIVWIILVVEFIIFEVLWSYSSMSSHGG